MIIVPTPPIWDLLVIIGSPKPNLLFVGSALRCLLL